MNLPMILIGVLLVFDTIFILCRSNMNMGVVMPALLGIPLLIYGLFAAELNIWFSYSVGIFIKWFIIGGYAAFFLLIIVCSALIAREIGRDIAPGADAVIILGAGVHGEKISMALKNRLDLAISYLQENENTVAVVSGGQGRQEKISEAEAMQRYLLEQGIPHARILYENRSRSTLENFTYSKKLLDQRFGVNNYRAVFVTNDFHIYRAKQAARAAGITAEGMGCPSPFYIVPNYYLRECLAIVRYALLGPR